MSPISSAAAGKTNATVMTQVWQISATGIVAQFLVCVKIAIVYDSVCGCSLSLDTSPLISLLYLCCHSSVRWGRNVLSPLKVF